MMTIKKLSLNLTPKTADLKPLIKTPKPLSRAVKDRIDLGNLKAKLNPFKVSKKEAALWMDKLQDMTLPCEYPLLFLESFDLFIPYASSPQGEQAVSYKAALDAIEQHQTITFKPYQWSLIHERNPEGNDCTVMGFRPSRYLKTDFPVSDFNQFKDFARQVTGEKKVERFEVMPPGKDILENWEQNAAGEPFDGKMIHQPRMMKDGELQEISYAEAGENLKQKQPVYFQPMMWYEVPDGYDDAFRLEKLGEFKGQGQSIAGTWVKDFQDLREYHKIERLSTPKLDPKRITTPDEFYGRGKPPYRLKQQG